jgi:methylated-DNA-[protein]-cysteine S-methyltransferase
VSRTRYATMDSPVGRLVFVGDGEAITHLHMEDHTEPPNVEDSWTEDRRAFRDPIDQMNAYFGGDLIEFDLTLNASGTPFQKSVWDALVKIPFGQTASYIEIARNIGAPKASRAVGMANSRNPIGIIVPCHRVIGASGKLVGYAGGLDRKRTLLDHETKVLANRQ